MPRLRHWSNDIAMNLKRLADFLPSIRVFLPMAAGQETKLPKRGVNIIRNCHAPEISPTPIFVMLGEKRRKRPIQMNDIWKLITLFFLGAIFLAVMTHASGFSTAAGTLFSGVNTMGKTLEGS
jgi:hypothetical protein